MPRRLTDRQLNRIRKIQERRRRHLDERVDHTLLGTREAPPREGRVVTRYGANLAVRDEASGEITAKSRAAIG